MILFYSEKVNNLVNLLFLGGFFMAEKEEEEESDTENIYDKKDREEQLAEDEIEPGEAGFVEGYEDTKLIECNACGNQFDFEKSVSREINGTMYTFCSKKCADHFEKRQAFD